MARPNTTSIAGADEPTDELLLERFTSQMEEAAFADLVRRHGPLVLGVCRRVLRHEQDAEDAFQAVFWVLARRAGSIRKRGAVGAWLHAVASRIAQKTRAERGRRPVPATNLPDVPDQADSPEWAWRELRPILDEEVNRLPEKYRQAFVLCYLEGRTNEQAAAQLGCPLGTVLSRLARARERLRTRLSRRGLALSAGTLVAALGAEAAGAVAPPVLTRAALEAAAGTMPPCVSALAEAFVRAQFRARLIRVGAGLLAVTLALIGVLLLLRRPVAESALPNQSDQQRLQGTWRAIQVERGGKPQLGPGGVIHLAFDGDRCTLTFGDVAPLAGQYQLAPNRTPPEITLRLELGTEWPGIYLFEGDSLKLCLNSGGPGRPPAFDSRLGDNVFLYVLQREPAAPQPAGPGPGREP